jgi:hypothetical protein
MISMNPPPPKKQIVPLLIFPHPPKYHGSTGPAEQQRFTDDCLLSMRPLYDTPQWQNLSRKNF